MECKEPSACLVNTFGYEIGRIEFTRIKSLLVLKGIVNLGIGHRTRIKPHIDQVKFAVHRFA